MSVEILTGDCRDVLKTLPEKSVNCCVTSPPYWGLRDYGVEGQLGLESTPEEYVENMVEVFKGVYRVLRDDGTLWLNLGDSYSHGGSGKNTGLKPKDLVGIPWMVAFALRANGWYLRQDIIWSKPNPMPESVKDRCTKAHEYVFLLSKGSKYYFDNEAIKENSITNDQRRPYAPGQVDKRGNGHDRGGGKVRSPAGWETKKGGHGSIHRDGREVESKYVENVWEKRSKRSVWNIATKPFKEAHFATFPPKLIEPCILAGCPEGGVVVDPFGGSGTTGKVAIENNRNAILIELNPEYIPLQEKRTSMVQRKLL